MKNIGIALLAATIAHAAVSASSGRERQPPQAEWKTLAESIPIGTEVRIRVADGKSAVVVLMVVDDEGLVVQPATRIPEPPRRVPYDQLRQLEIAPKKRTSLSHAAGTGAGIGAATFLYVLLRLAM